MQSWILEYKSAGGSFNWQTLITILSPLVAVAAIITNYLLVKRQIYSNLLVNERKEWINTIRTDVASFVSTLIMVLTAYHHYNKTKSDDHYIIYRDAISTAFMLQTKLQILLKPNDKTQAELISKIEQIVKLLEANSSETNNAKIASNTREIGEISNALAPITQQIIEQELAGIKQLI